MISATIKKPSIGIKTWGSSPVYSDTKFESVIDDIEGRVVSVIDEVSDFGNDLRDAGDYYDEKITGFLSGVERKSAERAKKNLIEGRVRGFLDKAGKWLSSGYNGIYTIVMILVLIFVIRKQ